MSIFPVITEGKQKAYEEIVKNNKFLKNNIPCICGYYGRACRHMNNTANSMLCTGCSLSKFVSTVEAIVEIMDEKEKMGIEKLYDSDIRTIQLKLQKKSILVEYSYIENVLDALVK